MIDITKAQANQTTTNGIDGDWTVTLDGEELYKLPSHYTVQDTFLVRDIVESMMKVAEKGGMEFEKQLGLVKLQHVVSNGNAQLDSLKRENMRLSQILEQHIEAV